MGVPARGYAWAPFERGNEAALQHGAHSPRRVDPVAAELVAGALVVAPWLEAPEFRPALEAWARAEARVLLVESWLAEQGGPLDDEGRVRPAAEFVLRAERLAREARAVIGLDPKARADLQRQAAAAQRETVDLEAVMRAGQEALERRQQADEAAGDAAS